MAPKKAEKEPPKKGKKEGAASVKKDGGKRESASKKGVKASKASTEDCDHIILQYLVKQNRPYSASSQSSKNS
jgi:hypothetical protein